MAEERFIARQAQLEAKIAEWRAAATSCASTR